MENLKKIFIALFTGVFSWLVLSYVFFPVTMSAPAEICFAENMANMIPLKALITTVFMLFNVFVYELREKKKLKMSKESK